MNKKALFMLNFIWGKLFSLNNFTKRKDEDNQQTKTHGSEIKMARFLSGEKMTKKRIFFYVNW